MGEPPKDGALQERSLDDQASLHEQRHHLFRQVSLDRLTSPEQLNALMLVTDGKGWLALCACCLVLGAALVWGFFGRVPAKLEASGLLMYGSGLADVVAVGEGQITALHATAGSQVSEGQVIAELAQPRLQDEIAALTAHIAEQEANYRVAARSSGRDEGFRQRAAKLERQRLSESLSAVENRRRALEEQLSNQVRLRSEGLIAQDQLELTREALRSAQVSVQSIHADLQRLIANEFSVERANQLSLMDQQLLIRENQRKLSLLTQELQQNSRIVSKHSGRLVELRAMVGDLVAPGVPIASLELGAGAEALEALLYVDSRSGKLIRPDMEVHVVPSIVKKERHGMLMARVKSIESFPSTRSGMMRVLHNEQLVETLLQETGGNPIAVRATLVLDASSKSGYRWTSGNGPELVLSSGTRCSAYVTTRSERPLGLLFPALELNG